jgi:hypothetical protein
MFEDIDCLSSLILLVLLQELGLLLKILLDSFFTLSLMKLFNDKVLDNLIEFDLDKILDSTIFDFIPTIQNIINSYLIK